MADTNIGSGSGGANRYDLPGIPVNPNTNMDIDEYGDVTDGDQPADGSSPSTTSGSFTEGAGLNSQTLWYTSRESTAADGTQTDDLQYYTSDPSIPVLTPGNTTGSPSSVAAFMEATTQCVFSDPSTLSSMTPAAVAQTAYTQLANQTVTDPTINALATASGVPAGIIQEEILTGGEEALTNTLNASTPPLSAADQQAIKLAIAFPSMAASLSPTLQAVLTTVQSNIQSAVQLTANNLGASNNISFTANNPNWNPFPATFNNLAGAVTQKSDFEFECALNTYCSTNSISDSQKQQLLLLHYSPNLATTDPAQLAVLNPILSSVGLQASAALSADYPGVPEGWTPPADSDGFTSTLNGAFSTAFQAAIANSSPPLTTAQQALITQYGDSYLANYGNEPDSIPSDAKTLLQGLFATALAQVQTSYGVSASWVPTLTTLTPTMPPSDFNSTMATITSAQGMVAEAEATINKLPDSPEKHSYLQFITYIATMLNQLQNTLFAMQGASIQQNHQLSVLRTQMQAGQIKMQQLSADKIATEKADQASKEHKSGPLAKFLEAMKDITTIVCCAMLTAMLPGVGAALGPLVGAAMGAALVTADTVNNTDYVQTALADVTTAITNQLGTGDTGFGVASFVQGLILAVATCANPAFGLGVIAQASPCLENFLKGCGCSDSQAKMGAAIMAGAIMVVAMVVVTIVTGGAAAPALAEEIAATATEAAGTVVEAAAEATEELGEAVEALSTAADAGEDTTELETTVSNLQSKVDTLNDLAEQASTKAAQISQKASSVSDSNVFSRFAYNLTNSVSKTTSTMGEFTEQLAGEGANAAGAAGGAGASSASSASSAFSQIWKTLSSAQKVQFMVETSTEILGLSTQAVSVASNVYQAQINLISMDIDKIQAKTDAATTQIQALLKALQKLMDLLINSLSGSNDMITSLSGSVSSMIQQTSNVMTSSVRG